MIALRVGWEIIDLSDEPYFGGAHEKNDNDRGSDEFNPSFIRL